MMVKFDAVSEEWTKTTTEGLISHMTLNKAVVTTTIRLRFDAHSTVYQRSLRAVHVT